MRRQLSVIHVKRERLKIAYTIVYPYKTYIGLKLTGNTLLHAFEKVRGLSLKLYVTLT